VVATSVFYNVLLATGTLLRAQASHQFITNHGKWSICSVINPLMLAKKTHESVKTSVREAQTLSTGAFNLHVWRIELVVLESTPFRKDGIQTFDSGRNAARM